MRQVWDEKEKCSSDILTPSTFVIQNTKYTDPPNLCETEFKMQNILTGPPTHRDTKYNIAEEDKVAFWK